MKTFRSPLFWLAFVLCGLAAAFFWKTHYAHAFPILDDPLTMSRESATRSALQLARAQGWSQAAARSATRLWQDSDLTTFIELEAGWKDILGTLLRDGRIAPNRWQVRLFQEKDAAETLVEFRPDGRFFGFHEKLPEAQTGRELAQPEARDLAERSAAALGIDLKPYRLAESTGNRVSSGRLDHLFTFEREEPRLGAGRDQIILTVRGDRFCGVEPRVKIPDDFQRRFTAMRATNTNLQLAAGVATILILVLGCIVGGMWYLARRKAIGWRGALLPSIVLAVGGALAALNLLPLQWFGYDTALAVTEFQVRNLVMLLVQGGAGFIIIVVLAGAEGLGREAFPAHPQLWKVFSPRAAGSRQIVGAVCAGYIGAALFLGYAVWMARFGVEHLGWWMPSSALFDFSQLGAVVPWYPPVFIALQAGLTEECLFRALPLAGAVLLGRRFGRPRLWLVAAIALQALIFGASHSSYPTMPGWARTFELLIPSVGFALLYLNFGLLPGILTHFLYDLILIGLPLFVSHLPGAGLDTGILCAIGLAPLAWVWFHRLRAGGWRELPAELRNSGWSRPAAKPLLSEMPPLPPPTPEPAPGSIRPATLRLILVAGLVALAAWGVSLHRAVPDIPGLAQRKAEAITQARAALAAEGVSLGADWEVRPVAHSDSDNERTFVWQTSGKAAFHKLLGNFLAVPGWRVRFVRSSLPLPDRAEEYSIFLAGDGSVQRFEHALPETRAGAHPAQPEAQAIAERELQRIYRLAAADLTLVSARETKQPERSDWFFIWKDPKADLAQGEARIWIKLAGDTLTGYERHVFIPEEWTRAQASGDSARNLVSGLAGFACMIALIFTVIVTLRNRDGQKFSWRAASVVGVLVVASFPLQFLIRIPGQLAWMSTNESTRIQLVRFGIGSIVGGIVTACMLGFLAGLGAGRAASPARRRPELIAGLGAGLLLLFCERLVQLLTPHWQPWHAGIDGANTGIPFLSGLWMPMLLISTSLCWIRVQTVLDKCARAQLRRTIVAASLGLCYGASYNNNHWLPIALTAAVFAGAFVLLDRLAARTHPSVLVLVLAVRFLGKAAADLFLPAHPDSVVDGLVSFALVATVGWLLFSLMRPTAATAAPASIPEDEEKSPSAEPPVVSDMTQ